VIPLHPAPAGLLALTALAFDEETGQVTLQSTTVLTASLDPHVDPIVVRGAVARGERLIVQREGDGHVVLGALRTAPTPGVDAGDEYVIEARRVTLRGDHEIAVVSGASALVLRALGHIELLSRNITSRAQGVQKILARMIQLN
jgi:hypothetical protein